MLVSTKGRYALLAVIDLAEHLSDGYIPLKDIAKRQGISDKYLESIVKALVTHKIVSGVRGKGGGYQLVVEPHELCAGDVLRATEGSLSPVDGLDDDHADLAQTSQYRVLEMWRGLDTLINDYLDDVKISDLIQASDPGDYYVI